MMFSVASNELHYHLSKIMGPVGNNKTNAALEDVLCHLNGDELVMTSSDQDTTMTTSLQVSSEDSGLFCCPAKMLHETLKGLDYQPVTIEIDEDSRQVTITSSFGKYSMTGHDANDFPQLKRQEDPDAIQLPSSVMKKALDRILHALGNDEVRRAISGMLFDIDFDKVTFVGTNGHKLIKMAYTDISGDVDTQFILPRKPLQMLKGILDEDEKVTIEFDKSHALFTCGTTMLACLMFEEKYPDYNMVIPASLDNHMTVDKDIYERSLRRLSIFANKTTNQIVHNITEHSLTISSQDVDYANEATEQLECTYEGENLQVAYNAKFLLELINTVDGGELLFKIGPSNRPSLIFPKEVEEHIDLTLLIMPVSF